MKFSITGTSNVQIFYKLPIHLESISNLHFPLFYYLSKTVHVTGFYPQFVGTVRNVEAAQEQVAADGLKNVHIVHGDMNDHASLTAAAEKTAERAGGVVDYLIVNGAYFAMAPILNTADGFIGNEDEFLDELKQIMQTNVAGTLFSVNAFMPLILKSSIKRVCAISSGACDLPYIVGAEDAHSLH